MSIDNVISEEDYLVFPDHPKFSFKPADKVIQFDDWVCSGIWVPLDPEQGHPEIDRSQSSSSKPNPTLDLGTAHQPLSQGSIPVLPRGDAWKVSSDPEWVEPLGTRKGAWTTENNPFKRTLNALNQFLKSRESAIRTPHLTIIQSFRDHTGLFKPSHEVPHLPSGAEHWGTGEKKNKNKKISVWEEDCWFVRDMERCLKAFWEGGMKKPGGDRLGISVLETFEIVRSFLLYMKHYDIYPKSTEPRLFDVLSHCCALSGEVQDKMHTTSLLYNSIWGRADGWNGVGKTIWAPEVDEEMDEDVREKRKVVDYAKIEVDEEAVLDGMEGVIVQDVKEMEDEGLAETEQPGEGQTEENRETLDGWKDASAPETTPFATLSRETALEKMHQLTGKQINPDDYQVFDKLTGIFAVDSFTQATPMSSADSHATSDSSEIGGLSRLALDKQPGVFGMLQVVLDDEQGQGERSNSKASVLIDMDQVQTVDWARLERGAKGLKVQGTLVGIRSRAESGEAGERTWFCAKIKGVDPGFE